MRRPLSITILGWMCLLVGVGGVIASLPPLFHSAASPHPRTDWFVLLIRAAAGIGGIYLLRGQAWARWLLVAWMAFHVILSFWHSAFEVVLHTLFLGLFLYFFFRPSAAAYFRKTSA